MELIFWIRVTPLQIIILLILLLPFCVFFIRRNVSDNRKQSSYAVYGRE